MGAACSCWAPTTAQRPACRCADARSGSLHDHAASQHGARPRAARGVESASSAARAERSRVGERTAMTEASRKIGPGFFLLPASLAQSGSVTVLSWIVGTLLAVVLGGAFARLARDYPALES